MPWQLDIHVIDVGQGDSTLIVANHTGTGQTRSMLVDGGESVYGNTVRNYVANAGLPRLDHIVATHYDKDHRGGLHAMLLADDMSSVVRVLATTGINSAYGANRKERISGVVAAVCSAAEGNYGPANGINAIGAATLARNNTPAGCSDDFAVNTGMWAADNTPVPAPALITNRGTRRSVAKAAGLAAANNIGAGAAAAVTNGAITTAVYNNLRTRVSMQQARFYTGNLFNSTHVIDLGAAGVPAGWADQVTRNFVFSGSLARAAFAPRTRTSVPALGSELLWNSGPNAILPPVGAPTAHVVTCDGWAWQGVGNPPFMITNATSGNNCSIGLLIRFNNFAYCTLGDLATVGEDPVMTAVRNHGLPNPAGGTLPVPGRIASFKCSHHGSGSSTSTAFLNTANPSSALISTGFNLGYQHPDDNLVFRLHTQAGIQNFFLTNCKFQSHVVAASMGVNQLIGVGNRSLVAGDNNDDNLAAGRHRGDIRVHLTQAQSAAVAAAARQYDVTYWEDDLPVPAPRTVTVPF
jgi:beta-lactamase superfamily II metal-dependent hydrolase